jgi:methylated-DNA-[protein]-cysteine S-methyltransferase
MSTLLDDHDARQAVLLRDRVETPIGRMILIAAEGVLLVLEFEADDDRVEREIAARFRAHETREAKNPFGLSDKVRAYFAGDLHAIEGIKTDGGGTRFQRQVWAQLKRIPLGETLSYGELARRIGNPNAMRAVGLANGRNPIAVVVPCHRVIGADGSLTGYGGGIDRKRWLLRHEGALLV